MYFLWSNQSSGRYPMRLLSSIKARRITAVIVPAFVFLLLFAFLGHDILRPSSSRPKPPLKIIYKKQEDRQLARRPFVPVNETFPLAASAKSPSELPPIPYWNKPPSAHVPEHTPIFIGFTRNWSLLQQTVVSLLTSGWPAADIYVVENTGVMDANAHNRLSPQNPFYLDHHRLTKILCVNVLTTPSLQTFAQLQNFFLYQAIINSWPTYFWAHMDIVVQSSEMPDPLSEAPMPYKSYYMKAVDILRDSVTREQRSANYRWALRYFAYDWITLMNTATMVSLGGWDSMISYYTTDCDMYERMRMAGYETEVGDVGPVYDVGESLPDLSVFYRVGDTRGSKRYIELQATLKQAHQDKLQGGPRNRWQLQQMGGHGDPYYRDADGFVEALEITVQAGIKVYGKKWGGAKGCGLRPKGLKTEDAWMVKRIEGDD